MSAHLQAVQQNVTEIPFQQTSVQSEDQLLEEQIKEFKEFFVANTNQESKESN